MPNTSSKHHRKRDGKLTHSLCLGLNVRVWIYTRDQAPYDLTHFLRSDRIVFYGCSYTQSPRVDIRDAVARSEGETLRVPRRAGLLGRWGFGVAARFEEEPPEATYGLFAADISQTVLASKRVCDCDSFHPRD